MSYITVRDAYPQREKIAGRRYSPAYWIPPYFDAENAEDAQAAGRIDIRLYEPGFRRLKDIGLGFGDYQIKADGIDSWSHHAGTDILYVAD